MGTDLRVLLVCAIPEREVLLAKRLLPADALIVPTLAEALLALEHYVPAAVIIDWHDPEHYDELLLPDFTSELTYGAPVALIADPDCPVMNLGEVELPSGAVILEPSDLTPWLEGPVQYNANQSSY